LEAHLKINSKIKKINDFDDVIKKLPPLWKFFSKKRLMEMNICAKFHVNTTFLSGFRG